MLLSLTLAIGVLWSYRCRKDTPLRTMIPPRLCPGRFHHHRTRLVSHSGHVQCIHLQSIHLCHQSYPSILGSRPLYHDNLVLRTVQRETINLCRLLFHLEVLHEALLEIAEDLRNLTRVPFRIPHLTHMNLRETGLLLLWLRLGSTNHHDPHSKNYRIPQPYQHKNCMTDLSNMIFW